MKLVGVALRLRSLFRKTTSRLAWFVLITWEILKGSFREGKSLFGISSGGEDHDTDIKFLPSFPNIHSLNCFVEARLVSFYFL
jgi:hypothetical protein